MLSRIDVDSGDSDSSLGDDTDGTSGYTTGGEESFHVVPSANNFRGGGSGGGGGYSSSGKRDRRSGMGGGGDGSPAVVSSGGSSRMPSSSRPWAMGARSTSATDPALADDEDDEDTLPTATRSGGRKSSNAPRRKVSGGRCQLPSWTRAVAVPAVLLGLFLVYRLLHPGLPEQ